MRTCLCFLEISVSKKAESGSNRKVDTAKHRKRRKKELSNRSGQKIARREVEFTQRIRKEPSLTTLLDGERKSE